VRGGLNGSEATQLTS